MLRSAHRQDEIGPQIGFDEQREVGPPMIEEAADKSRRIQRNELMHGAGGQTLFGERRRRDGARSHKHREVLRARSRSISGMTASISPTLAPCSQISGPAGRGRFAAP